MCDSVYVILGTSLNPGMVQEGTKCGDQMVCREHVCQALNISVNNFDCPVGHNGLTCSGNTSGVRD